MSIWAAIAGLFRPAKELVEVFKPNAENQAERVHVERLALNQQDLASLQQFAAEFHDRANRTWWDSLVDGLNRLPRPVITIGILSFFVLAPLDPERFVRIARGYEVMPDGFWTLLSVVVAFYFGGRMQVKSSDLTITKHALSAAGEIAKMRRDAGAKDAPEGEASFADTLARGAAALPNRVIEAWQHQVGSSAG